MIKKVQLKKKTKKALGKKYTGLKNKLKKTSVPYVVKVIETYPPIYMYSNGTKKRIDLK